VWPALILSTTLGFTNPAWAADTAITADPCHDSTPVPVALSVVRLYGAPRYGEIRLLRSHPAAPGARDTFQVVDDPPGWSYFVAAVSASGLEACWAGISVGIPATAVADGRPIGRRDSTWYDIQGRRIKGPTIGRWSKRRLTGPPEP